MYVVNNAIYNLNKLLALSNNLFFNFLQALSFGFGQVFSQEKETRKTDQSVQPEGSVSSKSFVQ